MNHHFSGSLSFKNFTFSFAFDGKRLSLFPLFSEEKESIKRTWLREEIAPDAFAGPRYPKIDTDFLAGIRNEDGHKIAFLVNKGNEIGYKLASRCIVLYVPVYAYIDCKYERDTICKISFSSPEINLIHPANIAYELKIDPNEWGNHGKASITTTDFNASQTSKQNFKFNNSEISTYFAISRSIGNGIDHPAIAFTSNLIFEFEVTDNYRFVCELCHIAEQFIRYLCYRDNIRFSEVKLSTPFKDGLTESFATMHLLWQPEESEMRAIEKRRLIGQRNVDGHEGALLNDISNDTLYMRHFPSSLSKANQITPASFLMLVAAFEWEFKRLHPEGIAKSESRINAENNVEQTIEELINKSAGKTKGIYKFLKKLIRNDSLRDKLIKIEEDVAPSIGKIGQLLYRRENMDFNFTSIGERISSQRNAFAHGDLNRAFNEETLVDIGYLKIIIYVMQLKTIGLGDEKIRNAVKQLFGVND